MGLVRLVGRVALVGLVPRGGTRETVCGSETDELMAAAIDTSENTFRTGAPERLFGATTRGVNSVGAQYAVSRDGKRFLVNVRQQQSTTLPFTVTLNWPAAFQK